GPRTVVTVCDINPDMLEVGRERAMARAGVQAVTFSEANAEALPFAERSFDTATIGVGIRNGPRIERALAEAFRVLKIGGRFVCLEFSAVDVPALDRLYDFYSFNVIPALGRMVVGEADSYRYLVESIRRFPKPQAFAAMLRAAGFARVSFQTMSGGVVRLLSGWRLVIAGPAPVWGLARAGSVSAREGVLGIVDPIMAPAGARPLIRVARLFERRTTGPAEARLSAALTRLGPSYVKLGQFLATRPAVVRPALARDPARLPDRMPPLRHAEARTPP